MIGKTISHYEILEKLGEGGMSQSCPRALFVPLYGFRFAESGILGSGTSGCNFEDPAVAERKREVSI